MNQTDFGTLAGADQTTISGWKGGKAPNADALSRIPKALRISGHWLLTGEEPMEAVEEPVALRTARRNGWLACAAQVKQAIALPADDEDGDDRLLDQHADRQRPKPRPPKRRRNGSAPDR